MAQGTYTKLRQFGINGTLISMLEHDLTDRSQGVVLNGKPSPSQPISAGVPQGLICVLLLFLCYIINVKYNIVSSIKLNMTHIKLRLGLSSLNEHLF